jgi:hypothetical protein
MCFTPFGSHKEYNDQTSNDEETTPDEEADTQKELFEGYYRCNGLLFWSVQGEDCGAYDAENASYPALG